VGLVGAFKLDAPESTKTSSSVPTTLLTWFANDFKMKFTGVTTGWSKDIEIGDGYKTTIFYNLHYDVGAHTKFISVYLQEDRHFKEIAKYVSENAKAFFDEDQATLPWGMKAAGQAEIDKSQDLPFSGRIYIYCPGIFGLEDQAELTKSFRESGQALQIRGDEYAHSALESIKAGRIKAPPAFQIRDKEIVPVASNSS
jgi:hypothetical protein